MAVLLLRLCGPMQAWGTQSRFRVRDTGLEPSKSGVLGLVCSALGRCRFETVDDLASLRMGVRVDQEGVVRRDYQTAGGAHRKGEEYGVVTADGKMGGTVTSNRYYLSDADFIIGLEGKTQADVELLLTIDEALRNPRWQVFLGRKSYPPAVPVYLPKEESLVKNSTLVEALISYPWPRHGKQVPAESKRPSQLRFVVETDYGLGTETRYDQPEGLAFLTRRFFPRSVETFFRKLDEVIPVRREG